MVTLYVPPPEFDNVVRDLLKIIAANKRAKITLIIESHEGNSTETFNYRVPADTTGPAK